MSHLNRNPEQPIRELARNKQVFQSLLAGLSEKEYTWRNGPGKWCLLEIAGHLYDEEREDFRARLKHVLEKPGEPLPSIDPTGWVSERNYMQQAYAQRVESFLAERDRSISWLRSLQQPDWDHAYNHPKFGPLSAWLFLNNWLAHDYLHFRQITRLRFDYLKEVSGEDLSYAGSW